jgi:alpha-beta hydrolase superfamily lysophospholipase
MNQRLMPTTETFAGAAGNTLVADVYGRSGPAVMLLHGGGQTRHAWAKTAAAIAHSGFTAYAIDQRGHGDSAWIADGAYTFSDYAADAAAVAVELTARNGSKPIVVGASLGGIASLLAEGRSENEGRSKASPRSTKLPRPSPIICRTGRVQRTTKASRRTCAGRRTVAGAGIGIRVSLIGAPTVPIARRSKANWSRRHGGSVFRPCWCAAPPPNL